MNTSIQDLGQQYLQQYNLLMQRISELKNKMPKMRAEEKRLARIRLRELFATAVHLKEVGDKLVAYYKVGKERG